MHCITRTRSVCVRARFRSEDATATTELNDVRARMARTLTFKRREEMWRGEILKLNDHG